MIKLVSDKIVSVLGYLFKFLGVEDFFTENRPKSTLEKLEYLEFPKLPH
jgi:hypothetical protein